jgi:hypothetical protein
MLINQRRQNAYTVWYSIKHPAKRPKGRKLKRLRASLYARIDKRWDKARTGLNDWIVDTMRMRNPLKNRDVPMSPMMRYK